MKRIKIQKLIQLGCFLLLLGIYSCNDSWDSYFSAKEQTSNNVEIYYGNIETYINSQPDLSSISSLFKNNGIFDSIQSSKQYTVFVCTDSVYESNQPSNLVAFARNSICNVAISPSKLTDGLGIPTRLGKNIWVTNKGNGKIYFNGFELKKEVKTSGGYIYYINGIIPILNSVDEYFESLGPNYSYFKKIVKRYEVKTFDRNNSIPIGVDNMGNTIYDSVFIAQNSLLDRYSSTGIKTWDMFSENYLTTMFIPSNALIDTAMSRAIRNIPIWLNRKATAADSLKFEKWIATACFDNKLLADSVVAPSARKDIHCLLGYRKNHDVAQDATTYTEVGDSAIIRPSVQHVDLSSSVQLSNGKAYYLTSLKIPNYVVIYRVKAKYYQLWGAMTDAQKAQYFRWKNWKDPLIYNDAQSSFTLSETLPTMYYNVLTAEPTDSARRDSLVCSVTFDGLLYNTKTDVLAEAHLPAGQYNLRMGFFHSLHYSVDIYFDNALVEGNIMLYATGQDFHLDRGSVSNVPSYGSSSIGFPEGYQWQDWYEQNVKAVAYDTDGYQVGVVDIPEDGNFTITIASKDNAYLFQNVYGNPGSPTIDRSKHNLSMLMMYHWCLRPTENNY